MRLRSKTTRLQDCRTAGLLIFLIGLAVWLSCGQAVLAKEYDGLWLLGFNFNKTFCADLNFRRAVSHAVSIDDITTKIMSIEAVPGSIVPPGMEGYDSKLKSPAKNVQLARELIKKVNILKQVILLHSDGVRTIAAANRIKKDLSKIGINLALKQIDYSKENAWEKALASGHYHMFLMGYKAEGDDLLGPLFSSSGEANFCRFRSAELEKLLKDKKLKQANRFLYDNVVVIPLFYITKL